MAVAIPCNAARFLSMVMRGGEKRRMDGSLQYVANCLAAFFDAKAPNIESDYLWRYVEFPREPEFDGFVDVDGGDCERTLHQRRFLAERWRERPATRPRLATWYVKDWGRIRHRNPEVVRSYALRDPETLSRGQLSGIASWSKVLMLADPTRFLIYDSRVSAALIAVQLLFGTDGIRRRFPLLPTQSQNLSDLWKWVRQRTDWPAADKSDRKGGVYGDYLSLLDPERSPRSLDDWQKLEMALFMHGPTLLKQATLGVGVRLESLAASCRDAQRNA